jgi:hypothetical protein
MKTGGTPFLNLFMYNPNFEQEGKMKTVKKIDFAEEKYCEIISC